MSLANWLVAALLGGVVPLLTAVLTKARAAVSTKATLAGVFVALGGALTAIGSGNGDLESIASAIGAAFVMMAASYSNLWKPLKVVGPAEQPGIVDKVTTGFGLGTVKILDIGHVAQPPAIAHGHLEEPPIAP